LRTVCENCAFNIDKERLQSRIAGQWIIIVVLSILIIFTIF
jgi:hypothetical protein